MNYAYLKTKDGRYILYNEPIEPVDWINGVTEIKADKTMKTRQLNEKEEREILDWYHANPLANIDEKMVHWCMKYQCSKFAIMKLFVREGIIKTPAGK